MTQNLAVIRGLTKTFHGNHVVSDVNITIKQGDIYGFLGPNGSGKTTIMKLMMNLLKPTSGDISMFGERIQPTSYTFLKHIGSMIEYPIFYEKLTARTNLELHCAYMGYHDTKAIDTVMDMVGLNNNQHQPVQEFSLGMKQRLGIARAIITKPKLLILDEPINGLDPVGIKQMRELFLMLNRDYDITILVSSHIIKEIEQIADTVGVIRNGRMVSEVSMDTIQAQNMDYIELSVTDVRKASFILTDTLNISNFKVVDNELIRIFDVSKSQSELSKTLILNDVDVQTINRKKTSLEHYFMDHLDQKEAEK